MKKFLQITTIFLCLFSCLFGCSSSYNEITIVQATVIDKDYIESDTKYGYYFDYWTGDFRWKLKYFPEEYNVTVQYQDIVKTFDDEELFGKVEVGDSVDVELHSYFNSNSEVQNQSIHMID